MKFAEKLQWLMARAGLTQEALASDMRKNGAKVSQRAVTNWLKGTLPRPAACRKLADYFELPLETLFIDHNELPHWEIIRKLDEKPKWFEKEKGQPLPDLAFRSRPTIDDFARREKLLAAHLRSLADEIDPPVNDAKLQAITFRSSTQPRRPGHPY